MTILWRWFWIVDNRLLHHGLGERAWLLFLTSLLAFGMYFSIMDWENVRGASARVTLIHSHFYLFYFICFTDQSITDWDWFLHHGLGERSRGFGT
jgi:hypothetical protein